MNPIAQPSGRSSTRHLLTVRSRVGSKRGSDGDTLFARNTDEHSWIHNIGGVRPRRPSIRGARAVARKSESVAGSCEHIRRAHEAGADLAE